MLQGMTLLLRKLEAALCAASLLTICRARATDECSFSLNGTFTLGKQVAGFGDFHFTGAVTALDGRIVFAPGKFDSVGIYDVASSVWTTVDMGTEEATGMVKYYGLALAPSSGKVIFAPCSEASVGIFDITAENFTKVSIGGTGDWRYAGAVSSQDDRVVFAPSFADDVGVFDVASGEFTSIPIDLRGESKFNGAVLTLTGKVVFAPHNSDSVGIFDPLSNSFTTVDISSQISVAQKFIGAALAPDGRVVFGPHNADGIGIFDPDTLEFSLVDISSCHSDSDGWTYGGIVSAPDGTMVFVPSKSYKIGLFDPLSLDYSVKDVANTTFDAEWDKFLGGAAAADGTLVFAPRHEHKLGIFQHAQEISSTETTTQTSTETDVETSTLTSTETDVETSTLTSTETTTSRTRTSTETFTSTVAATTALSTANMARVADELEAYIKASAAALEPLLASDRSDVVVEVPIGTLVFTDLTPAIANATDTSAPLVRGEGEAPPVVLPGKLLETLRDESSSALMATASLNISLGEGFASPPVASTVILAQRTDRSGTPTIELQEFRVQNLASPILIRLGSEGSVENSTCKFWDEQAGAWSADGVSLATPAQLQAFNVPADGMWCVTTHLTIFAAFYDDFVDALQCAEANAISLEGLSRMLEFSIWWRRPPALCLWTLLACLAALTCCGARRDRQLHRSGLWCDSFFLDVSRVPRRGASLRATLLLPRRAAASICGLPIGTLLEKAALLVVATCVQSVVARKHGLTVGTVRRHVWGENGFVKGDLAAQASKKWRLEREAICDEIVEALQRFAAMCFAERFWIVLCAVNPLASNLRTTFESTAAKRMKILADKLLGALMVSTLLFSVSGSVTGVKASTACIRDGFEPGRYLATALVSAVLVTLPVNAWALLHRRTFLDKAVNDETRRLQQIKVHALDVIFWCSGSLYSFACVLFIATFLADLNEREEWKWNLTFAVLVTRLFIAKPLLLAGCMVISFSAVNLWIPQISRVGHKRLEVDLTKTRAASACFNMATHDCLSHLSSDAACKVVELAERGISIDQLLDFYARLGKGGVMPDYCPRASTTHDVVRGAIIPLSLGDESESEPSGSLEGFAYATKVGSCVPARMVTHNWGNNFLDLVAACVADALGLNVFGEIADKLSLGRLEEVRAELGIRGLALTYWICAFSVNQHAGICSQTGPWTSCCCSTPKVFSGDWSEMNKFDDMMRLLAGEVRGFSQVVAVDVELVLFKRVWCIAELVEAHRCTLPQNLIVHSEQHLKQKAQCIELLDVQCAEASFPEDKEYILDKVRKHEESTGTDFNNELRELVLNKEKGLLTAWLPHRNGCGVVDVNTADAVEELVLKVAL